MGIGALIEKFRSVGLDRIERMNSALVALERDPKDAVASEELLREIHTLKGEAKMMGFADVNLVAHQTESVMMRGEELGWGLPAAAVDAIFFGFDIIRTLLTKQTGANDTPVDLSAFVDSVQSSLRQLERAVPAQGRESVQQEAPDEVVATITLAPEAVPRATMTSTGPVSSARAPDAGMLRIQTENTLRVRFDKLERLGDVASEVLLMSRRMEYQQGHMEGFRQQMREWMKLAEPNLPGSQVAALREMLHRFDAIASASSEDNHMVNVRAAQLDEEVRTLRHISLGQVINHYPRAVRDLAQSQHKRVRFLSEVGRVDVDRAILSALSDPLLHLVRNAVDHGVESPRERELASKPAEATIWLEAEHIGDSIRVKLRDDGRGIDPEYIKARAVEKGVITQDEAQALQEQQALALIFEPGFSTREDVTDISGRGIGMDIVLRQITTLGGVVEVESEVGQGTSFTLLIPLSSAVIDVLLVALEDRCFGIQAKDIERIVRVDATRDIISIHGGRCIRHGGELVPLMDWRQPLLGRGRELLPEGPITLLVARKGARRFAAWIDRVLGEREAINRPLGEFLQGARLCRGVAMTDAGELIPLLNVVELMKRARMETSPTPAGSRQLSPRSSWSTLELSQQPRQHTVLLAEDSEVTRTLVAGILGNLGYRVLEAEDGQQAWEMLQNHRVDLLMTDIQMPRKGGLALLEQVRADEALEGLPVIVLSTLGSAADREHAMSLGADAYLVKLDFREKELVSTVRRYLKG